MSVGYWNSVIQYQARPKLLWRNVAREIFFFGEFLLEG